MKIEKKSDLLYFLEQDKIQLNKTRKKPRIIGDEIWKYQIILRKVEYFKNTNKIVRFNFYKVLLHLWGIVLSFEIHPNNFGPGLSIAHRGPIIINKSARIGKKCRIHSCVNIGTAAGQHRVAPKIGDYVYIGPGAKIFGGIEIGNKTAIGAGAVVNKNYSGNGTLGGIPAREISKKDSKGLWINFN